MAVKVDPVTGERVLQFDFVPNSLSQASFIHTDSPMAALVAGVGFGKTRALCTRGFLLSWKYPSNRGMFCRYSYDELRDSFIPTLKKSIPREVMLNPEVLDRKDLASQSLWVQSSDPDHPSEILLRNLEDPNKYQSFEGGWFGISQANDPKVTELMWETLNERLRWKDWEGKEIPFYAAFLEANYGGNASEGGWIWDWFIQQKRGSLFEGSTLDNWDNLPRDYQERIASMPDLRKAQRLGGEAGSWDPLIDLKGKLVYPEFNYGLHVPQDAEVGDVRQMVVRDRPIVRGIDVPGSPACVWVQMDKSGGILVLHELVFDQPIGIGEFADAVQSESATYFPGFRFVNYIDGSAFKELQQAYGPAMRIDKILWQHGITHCHPAPTKIEQRIETVKDCLRTLIRNGQPGMLVDPGCRRLIGGFRSGYHFGQIGSTPGRVTPDPVKNEFSHVHDALQYALSGVTRLQYQMSHPQTEDLLIEPEAILGRLRR